MHPLSKMSSSDESGIDQPIPSSSTLPEKERHTERVLGKRGLQEFLVVDHTANLRKNTKISAIWHHGGERRRLDDDSMARYWRCSYCTGRATVLKVDGNGGQTTYALTHLKNKHNIDCKADDSVIPSAMATVSAGASIAATIATKAVREAYGLVTQFDAAKFRQALIMFIVMCNIAFSVVESQYFQALLESCSHALKPFLVTAENTVKK
jgi:hypothetical protein